MEGEGDSVTKMEEEQKTEEDVGAEDQATAVKTSEEDQDNDAEGGNTDVPDHVVKLRGLPYVCSMEEIVNFFSGMELAPNGVLFNHDRGGEAFVQFASAELAEKALGKDRECIGQRYIEIFKSSLDAAMQCTVSPYPSTFPPEGFQVKKDEVEAQADLCVKLRGLPYTCSKEEVANFFSGLELAHNGIMFCEERPWEAFVRFTSQESVEKAVAKHKECIGPRYIEVFKSNEDAVKVLSRRIFPLVPVGGGRGGRGRRPGPYDPRFYQDDMMRDMAHRRAWDHYMEDVEEHRFRREMAFHDMMYRHAGGGPMRRDFDRRMPFHPPHPYDMMRRDMMYGRFPRGPHPPFPGFRPRGGRGFGRGRGRGFGPGPSGGFRGDQGDSEGQDGPKSEICMVHELALRKKLPVEFKIIKEDGPPHQKHYVTRCTVGTDLVTEGEGDSKKRSKKQAAEFMMQQLTSLPSADGEAS